MTEAWIDGTAVPLEAAVAEAARLLAASRLPLVTGLATDVAGVKAALALAREAGGVIDHEGSDLVCRRLAVLQGSDLFVAVPAEMRRRADRFLLVGPDAAALRPDLLAFVFGGVRDLGLKPDGEAPRRIVWLGGADASLLPSNGIAAEAVPCAPAGLPDALAMIRASLAGRPFGAGPIPAAGAAAIATWLSGAAFACILWSAAALDALGAQMLAGLVADLNASTRASSIPLGRPDQAWGAAEVGAFTSGYPLRVSFARGRADHDPWAYETRRLVASGETDLAVHVSALAGFAAPEPDWSGRLPVIALGAGAAWSRPPKVAFAVALAGREGEGVLYRDEVASFVPFTGGAGSGRAPAAALLGAIAAGLAGLRPERAA